MNSALIQAIALLCFWPLLAFSRDKRDEPTVEIKCLVAERDIAEVSQKIGLHSKKPTRRVVCFFDTDSLSLFQHRPRLVLRSRYDSTGDSDTTVKLRDGEVEGTDLKCEFDKVLGKDRIKSCSFTDSGQEKAQIKRANEGKKIKKIFSRRQRAVLEKSFGKLNWEKLRPYGPVKAIEVWKRIKISRGADLTVERWKLPPREGKPGRVLFEVSTKVPLEKEAESSKWIADLVGSPKTGDQESETKTRLVLEHFRSSEVP